MLLSLISAPVDLDIQYAFRRCVIFTPLYNSKKWKAMKNSINGGERVYICDIHLYIFK